MILPGGAQSLLVIRSLRLLRVFRVFKMARWISEANYLVRAIRSSSRKIVVFLIVVVLINVIVGSSMYLIEGPENGFDSMFRGLYWSIVTMSTVGFGDIAPSTPPGQVLAAILMITGYRVIAVPTGIVSAEVVGPASGAACPGCGSAVHSASARFATPAARSFHDRRVHVCGAAMGIRWGVALGVRDCPTAGVGRHR